MNDQEMSSPRATAERAQPGEKKGSYKRRDFIKLGLAGLAAATVGARLPLPSGTGEAGAQTDTARLAASGARPPNGEQTHRWAMVIDQAKCTGCDECTLACRAHNDVSPDISWNRVLQDRPLGDQEVFLPVPCMHCEDAPCVGVCPVAATYQRPDGIIMMDYDRCIGCRYCELSCPYGSRSFNWDAFTGPNPAVPSHGQPEVPRRPRGVVEKCTFCYQRIDRGLAYGLTPGVDQAATPACVVACPTGARIFGDLNDPESPVSRALARRHHYRLREDLGTGPRVYYLAPEADEQERE